jgi:hypothetical protein
MKCPLTEKIEELFLAWIITVLDSSGFSRSLRVVGLKQNFWLAVACQPSAVIRRLNNNMEHKEIQSTYYGLCHHLHRDWMIGPDDRTSISDSENLLLHNTYFFVVGRMLEQLCDCCPDHCLMVPGGMSMTEFCLPELFHCLILENGHEERPSARKHPPF